MAIVEYFVESSLVSINSKDDVGNTLLHYLCIANNYEYAKYIVSNKVINCINTITSN